MRGGLQNWLHASSDPSGRAALATLCPTESSGKDLANWVGTDVVLQDGVSGSSGYFKAEQITECYSSGNESGPCTEWSDGLWDVCLFLLKIGRWSSPSTVSQFVNWHLSSITLTALACLSNYNIISHSAVYNIDSCSVASLTNTLWKNENTRSNF